MRHLALLTLAGIFVGGCAAQPEPFGQVDQHPVATALVFDPPITRSFPTLDLDRDSRQAQAFVSYDSPEVTYYYLRIDDNQRSIGNFNIDRFERQSYIQKLGVTSR